MTFDQLLQLEKDCLLNPNYQHKDLTEVQRLELAKNSFKRLTTQEQELVAKSWKLYCDKNKVVYDFKQAIWFRFFAQTNLFFLCRLLEKYSSVTVNTHEDICNKFFVSKDPANYKTFEEFAKDYKELKERLLLVPRGGFKSSIDIADCVQWIICFPEVTILILTGLYKLAKDFVGELSSHFTLGDTGETRDDKPLYGPKVMTDGNTSIFQALFPEHCVKPGGAATEFQTPACKIPDKEPTVMAASIEQNLSGWHFGIMKLDDVVTNENFQTITRLETVNQQVSINKAMLHPFGFFDKIGTWYDEMDVYGIDIKYEEQLRKEGEEPTIVIYIRAAWWPTQQAKKLGKIEEEMKEDDWVLWFPERLTYKFLLKEKKKDPEGFAIKYLNDPRLVHQVKFPREMLIRRTIPANQVPPTGMVVCTWDTAYSTKNFADYTVGITSLIYGGRFYIIDMVRGRFNEYELPQIIAQTGYKWKPKRIAIEDSMGVRWIGREIRREMDKLRISIPVEYISLGVGNKTKSKEMKAKPVARLLGDERLLFSNSCSGLEELYNELEKFPKGTHDDIVSGLSILVDQFAAYADMDSRMSYVSTQYVADQKSKAKHDMIYGLNEYSKFNVNFALEESNPTTVFQLENTLQPQEQTVDPLSELFY
jgi:phage terminase large subunit-like protein